MDENREEITDALKKDLHKVSITCIVTFHFDRNKWLYIWYGYEIGFVPDHVDLHAKTIFLTC